MIKATSADGIWDNSCQTKFIISTSKFAISRPVQVYKATMALYLNTNRVYLLNACHTRDATSDDYEIKYFVFLVIHLLFKNV